SKKAFGNSLEDQERNIAKLLLIVDQNWGNIVKFSRRTESQLSSWCARYTGIQTKNTEKEIIESAKDMNRSRYLCVNLQNSNTVELRVFRGSLKYNTIVATVQFCDILAKISLHSLEAIRNYNWEFIKKYAQRNGYTAFIRYCEERNI
ncbi:MAG: amidoligase family protein, partial [Patescibacteria group bacterium]